MPFVVNAEADGPKYWKPVADLRTIYADADITRDRRVIVYCATGVRSAVTYFTLRQLGYEDVAVFTGSYVEWSSDSARPVATAEAP